MVGKNDIRDDCFFGGHLLLLTDLVVLGLEIIFSELYSLVL